MISYFNSTIFRKTLAGLSGFFLVLFLLGHLLGNLQLFIPGEDGQKQFNEYALFMTTNPAVKILSVLTYSSIILHTVLTLFLVFQSSNARDVKYLQSSGNANSTWGSKNMAVLGTLILIFIVIHMKSFWYEMHFGVIGLDPWGNKDLHTVTVTAFNELWYVLFYVLSMVVLAIHLKHGVESVFQTLGIKTRRYVSLIHKAAYGFALIVPAAFASIPIYLYVTQS
jgi:succinate dehydrogenase / fumarate reductase cytochrome b subunit